MTEVLLIDSSSDRKAVSNCSNEEKEVDIITVENGRGSWTRTNGCQDQNLMPYQLGYTPIVATYYK